MKINELHNQPVQADTYEASMALNQLLKIGKHAIKIHNMIDDAAEMESWVAKKIDLAGDYVKKVHGYMQGEKAGLYDDGGMTEDAGEGHMSKSTLYHTAKYAIELMDMINKGDDLEGWVQSKLNKAADYLQGVHNYEEYQKLNPYREELDSDLLQRHAGIIQKNIDEILARETSLDDVDTKPGMMRILAKRVNEVEKEIAKEQRKNTDEEAPPGREKQVKALKKKFKDKGAPYAIAWAQHNKHGKPKKEDVDYRSDDILIKAGFDPAMVKKYIAVLNDHGDTSDIDQMNMDKIGLADAMSMALASHGIKNESVELEEGIKDWARNLAMAGVIVAGLAGVGSIQDAIDRSIPAVQAMETALEMAQDAGNDELAEMIKGDLSAVKVRLSSGKDLNFVKGMQEKYSKFIQTEGLAYESKLAIRLEQRIK
jgi:hypothetical protein